MWITEDTVHTRLRRADGEEGGVQVRVQPDSGVRSYHDWKQPQQRFKQFPPHRKQAELAGVGTSERERKFVFTITKFLCLFTPVEVFLCDLLNSPWAQTQNMAPQ